MLHANPYKLIKAVLMPLATIVFLSSCANSNMTPYHILARLEPDCGNKEVQMNFLQQQLAHVSESGTGMSSLNIMRSATGYYNEPKIEGRSLSDVRHEGRLKELIWELRSSCD